MKCIYHITPMSISPTSKYIIHLYVFKCAYPGVSFVCVCCVCGVCVCTCCAVVAVCSRRCSSHRQRATMRAISMGFSRYLLCRCCLMRRRLCWYRTLFSCRNRLYCWSISPSRLWNTSVAWDSLLAAYALRQTQANRLMWWVMSSFLHSIHAFDNQTCLYLQQNQSFSQRLMPLSKC